ELVVAVLGYGKAYPGRGVGQGRGTVPVTLHRVERGAGGAVADVGGGEQGEAVGEGELGQQLPQGLVAVAAAQGRDGDHGAVAGQSDPLRREPQGVRVERQQSADVAVDGGAVVGGGDLVGAEQAFPAYEGTG